MYCRAHRSRSPVLIIMLIMALIIGALLSGCDSGTPVVNPNGSDPPTSPPPPPPPVYCVLCGAELEHDADLGHRPVMLMIDNHLRARPQSGLTEACLVFEMLAEGGITRLVPVYVHGEPERVGPVRSTRHYFLDLVTGLDALFAHAGQSPQAAVDLKQLGVANLDEFRHDKAYWRDSTRNAPHNLYTTIDNLRLAAQSAGLSTIRHEEHARLPYRVSTSVTPTGQACEGVEVVWPYSSGGYMVGFHYQAGDDDQPAGYERRINDRAHPDLETGEPLRATNVVVAFARFWRIAGDPEGRLGADLTGTGEALVFQQGISYEAAWRKSSRTSPFVLLDGQGEHLILDAGQTWILIVPASAEVRQLSPGS